MRKIRKIDFVIADETSEHYREQIIFRFYPRGSSCHSFNESLPKTWDDVYKVYYSYSIFVKNYIDGDLANYEKIFEMPCDECSCLTYLAEYIRNMIDNDKPSIKVITYGQPGSDWVIERQSNRFQFIIWNNFSGKGYRYNLPADRVEEFCKYLDEVNDYMLKHGNPI